MQLNTGDYFYRLKAAKILKTFYQNFYFDKIVELIHED